MKTLANICVVIALLCALAAIVCRIKLAPIVGLKASAYLLVTQVTLLFAITFLLLEKSASK